MKKEKKRILFAFCEKDSFSYDEMRPNVTEIVSLN